MPQQVEELIEGIIERVTFQSEETGYTVLKMQLPRSQDLTTVIGELPPMYAGESVRMKGLWLNHPKYGYQFKVNSYEKLLPATVHTTDPIQPLFALSHGELAERRKPSGAARRRFRAMRRRFEFDIPCPHTA